MARRDFWKEQDATTTPATTTTTPTTTTPTTTTKTTKTSLAQQAALRAAFGDDGWALLLSRLPTTALQLREEDGFRLAEPAAQPRMRLAGFLVADGVLYQRGQATALPALVAQSITTPHEVEERVRRACAFFDIQLIDDAAGLRPLLERGVSSPDEAAIRARFEPPHGEGRAFVCFVADDSAVVRPGDVYRAVVDVDSLHVALERVGACAQPLILRGRAHVDDSGHAVVAAVDAADVDAASPWLDQALTEHASIAAFARLTLELMALAAPLALVARVQEAALDEIRHTEQCLALARRDGVVVALGPLPALPPRDGTRADLARRTHEEAVLPESAAIAAMRAQLDVVDDEARALLAAQIVDEERHVQLARDIVAWADGR